MTDPLLPPPASGSPSVVCVPVTPDGEVDPRWGRAARVAVVRLDGGRIVSWSEHRVAWDELHDVASEGGHHARVARFLAQHGVGTVVADHMGPPMVAMLGRMGIAVRLGAGGDARRAVVAAAAIA